MDITLIEKKGESYERKNRQHCRENLGNIKKKRRIEVLNLPKVLKMKPEIVYQALGWLARENKVNYNTKGRKTFISLSDFEKNVESHYDIKVEKKFKKA